MVLCQAMFAVIGTLIQYNTAHYISMLKINSNLRIFDLYCKSVSLFLSFLVMAAFQDGQD